MKKYILVGSNNFWFATDTSLKRIKEHAKEILQKDPDEKLLDYEDPETNIKPYVPNSIYIFEVKDTDELFLDNYKNKDYKII